MNFQKLYDFLEELKKTITKPGWTIIEVITMKYVIGI
jgi:hypothetical protein